jgi:hypothetical protein
MVRAYPTQYHQVMQNCNIAGVSWQHPQGRGPDDAGHPLRVRPTASAENLRCAGIETVAHRRRATDARASRRNALRTPTAVWQMTRSPQTSGISHGALPRSRRSNARGLIRRRRRLAKACTESHDGRSSPDGPACPPPGAAPLSISRPSGLIVRDFVDAPAFAQGLELSIFTRYGQTIVIFNVRRSIDRHIWHPLPRRHGAAAVQQNPRQDRLARRRTVGAVGRRDRCTRPKVGRAGGGFCCPLT